MKKSQILNRPISVSDIDDYAYDDYEDVSQQSNRAERSKIRRWRLIKRQVV